MASGFFASSIVTIGLIVSTEVILYLAAEELVPLAGVESASAYDTACSVTFYGSFSSISSLSLTVEEASTFELSSGVEGGSSILTVEFEEPLV